MAAKTDYTAEGQGRLLSTLQGATSLEGLITAFVDRAQELENEAYPILDQRGIDTAVGHRLDRIGGYFGIPRGGMLDPEYLWRIKIEMAILNSDGTEADLVLVTQLLFSLPTTAEVEFLEGFPKCAILRPKNAVSGLSDYNFDPWLKLLKRAAAAGTEVELVASAATDDDDLLFHFSKVADVTQVFAPWGNENGILAQSARDLY